MSRYTKIARLAVAAAVVTVVLSGCEHQATQLRVATARTDSPSTSTPGASPSSAESDYDKALRYTRCMNAEGANLPDPVEGKPLMLGTPVPAGGSDSWTEMKTDGAFQKCKQYLPATWPIKVDPDELAKERAFDECLRKRGIQVPEPDANGMVHYSTDPDTWTTPEYQAAESACRYLYDDPANNQPENQ